MSDAPTQGRVIHERHEHILKTTIDNPPKKNALSPDMLPTPPGADRGRVTYDTIGNKTMIGDTLDKRLAWRR